METEQKTFLTDLVHHQAYAHPKFAQLRFPGSTICPNCHSEFAHVLTETGDRRTLWCHTCGMTYKEKDLVA